MTSLENTDHFKCNKKPHGGITTEDFYSEYPIA